LLELVDDWGRFIGGQIAERDVSLLRRHERTGRPLGGESFIDWLERALSRRLRKQKPGPKPNRRTRQVLCPPNYCPELWSNYG
jgi:putative transposase